MRHAGLMLPLFSATSSRSWGIGELPDVVPLARWLAQAGFDRLMVLPLGVVAPGDTSPYGAQSSMAIDPMYIAVDAVPDFDRAGGMRRLSAPARADLERAQQSDRVDYARVRRVKTEALALCFEHFYADEWSQLTLRAASLGRFISQERWWLDDWATYAAVAQAAGAPDWRKWPAPIRDRQPGAVRDARRQLAREVLRHQYLQWIAETQWQTARRDARALGVTVVGDMPFMVSAASPDVWARPDEVMLDVSLGVPPDAFSATGQDWGLPTYRWDRIAATGFAWMRLRARRMAALYDGYRVDHLVGLFRTYGRPPIGAPFFNPSEERSQVAQGETILRILIESGAAIIAEDLGVIPPFVRESLARLGVPGCKVMRWERHWDAAGHPFIVSATYPALSAVMTGTHDTETLAEWWGKEGDLSIPWGDAIRDTLLTAAYRAGSNDLFLPLQDVFGWRDRINIPATVGDHNWTWRLPWRVDELGDSAVARERAEFCLRAARATDRCSPEHPST